MKHLAAAALCAALSLGLQPTAQAADAAAKKGNTLTIGGGAANGKLLSRDQLRQCLAQQKLLKSQGEEVAITQATLDAEKARIGRLDAELEQQQGALQAERAAVDAASEAAVTAYNAKLAQREERQRQRDQQSDAYNARLEPFNAQARAVNASRQDWASQCADRPYDEADFFAIQRGK